jgi:nucleotide-binding universal stress UspA family protein
MSNSGKTRAAILAAIDYSESSTFVVAHAALLAQQSRPCDLHFLHVNPLRAPDAAADDDECCRLELLEWLAARLPADGEALAGVSVITHEASGDPAHTIVELAADLLVDHVVVGTHGRRGLERLVLGSVAEDVSRRCGCSVLVVRQQQHEHPLEPVCGVCVEARIQSQGNVPWCHDHVPRNDRRHALERRAGRWVRAHVAG